MSDQSDEEARLLSAAEREAVEMTREPAIAALSRIELQALAKRLREARDRARDIASQQRREMRGKAEPRGASPSRDNLGTLGKAEVLNMALQRISHQLRIAREAAGKVAAARPKRASGGAPRARSISSASAVKSLRPASKVKPAAGPKQRIDPRDIGRVSQAGKVAQARRDSKKG